VHAGRPIALTVRTRRENEVCPGTLPAATSGLLAGRSYSAFVGSRSGAVQECQGNGGHTSRYGQGQVDALAAVTNDRASG
jgi:lantibiotic leader peptide-processing serine protease